MAHESIVYGVIVGLPWRTSDYRRLQRWNRERIERLPRSDAWPFLTRGMFAIPGDEPDEGTFRSQVIHFGATLKEVEWSWHLWLPKLEALLRELYWEEAHVHLRTEATVGHHHYAYRAREVAKRIFDSEPPLPIADWELVGGPRRFEL